MIRGKCWHPWLLPRRIKPGTARARAASPSRPDCGTNPLLRQRYHAATLRYGRHGSATRSISVGFGRSASPNRSRTPARTAKSPTGHTSSRASAKISRVLADPGPDCAGEGGSPRGGRRRRGAALLDPLLEPPGDPPDASWDAMHAHRLPEHLGVPLLQLLDEHPPELGTSGSEITGAGGPAGAGRLGGPPPAWSAGRRHGSMKSRSFSNAWSRKSVARSRAASNQNQSRPEAPVSTSASWSFNTVSRPR